MRSASARVTIRLLLVAAVCSVSAVASAQGPDDTQDRARVERENAVKAQLAVLPGAAIIELGPTGPVDAAFKDPEVPFPVIAWSCGGTLKTEEKVDGCRKQFEADVKGGQLRGALTFAYPRPGGGVGTPELTVGIVGGEKLPVLKVDETVRVPLAGLAARSLKNGGRVDLIVYTGQPSALKPVAAIALTFDDAPEFGPVRARDTAQGPVVAVRLDRTGVASTAFLNPRWPAYLGPLSSQDEARWQDRAALVFTNRVADRQYIVTFAGIPAAQRAAFLDAGMRLTDCDDDECQFALVVPPGSRGSRRVPVRLLREAYAKDGRAPVVAFDVELFHEQVQLANPKGYFSLVQYRYLEAEANSSAWSASVSAAYGWAPDLSGQQASDDDDPVISNAAPRGAANDWTLGGTARISLQQSLGSRANGEFEVRLKSGAFGTDASVAPTKYRLNLFALSGTTYSGGRFAIAEPSEGVALSEAGENVGMHVKFVDVNYIVRKYVPRRRRQSLDFTDTTADGNHQALLVQVRNVPQLTWKFGQLDLYGVHGRKRSVRCVVLVDGACPAKPADGQTVAGLDDDGKLRTYRQRQRYTTLGGEASFAFKEGWGGTAALYHSALHADGAPAGATPVPGSAARGTAGLLTLGWTKFDLGSVADDRPARFTIRGQVGAGTGDRPETLENEGYLGETATFAPDQLFLSLLAPAIQSVGGQVGSGLSNKRYAAVLFTTPRWTPLAWVAGKLGVPSFEVAARSTTIKVHHYRFNQPVNGRHDAGTELNVDFSLESPAAVSYSIVAAGFWPGGALRTSGPAALGSPGPLIRGFQGSVVMQFTVKM